MSFNLNNLDPIITLISLSNYVRDCTLEIIAGASALTRNITTNEVNQVTKELLKNNVDWFTWLIIYIKHLTDRKKYSCSNISEYSKIFKFFSDSFESISAVPSENNMSIIEFKLKNNPNPSKPYRINEKGVLNNFISNSDKFSNIINTNIKQLMSHDSIHLDLQLADKNLNNNWADFILKKSNQVSNSNQDLFIGIICFLNLFLKQSAINIIINFLDYIQVKDYSPTFVDENISDLSIDNLDIVSSLCLYNYNSNCSQEEIDTKTKLINVVFNAKEHKQVSFKAAGESLLSDNEAAYGVDINFI
jgi:hypothetical protein